MRMCADKGLPGLPVRNEASCPSTLQQREYQKPDALLWRTSQYTYLIEGDGTRAVAERDGVLMRPWDWVPGDDGGCCGARCA
jgi:hypothetical protein